MIRTALFAIALVMLLFYNGMLDMYAISSNYNIVISL